MSAMKLSRLRISARKAFLVAQGLILAGASILPLVLSHGASAAVTKLANRSVSSTTGVPLATTQLVFTFDTATKGTATNVKQIEIAFCDQPLSTCASTVTPALNASPSATLGGFAGTGTTVTRQSSVLGGTNNEIRIVITTPADEDNKTGLTITLPSTIVTNYSVANTTYYPRLKLYSDTGTTLEWQGTVAQSTSQNLTVNARVEEVLSFCVGTTDVDSASTQITNSATANVITCAQADGTSIDLGILSSGVINTTPVAPPAGGDNKLAYAMVQTNAQNGVIVAYRAVQDTGSGKLKTIGSTCSGISTTDQCINSAGATATAFTSGTENFGLTVAGVNCANASASYTCDYVASGSNLCLRVDYAQAGNTCGTGNAYVTSASTNTDLTAYAWVDTGSSLTDIAGSDASTLKVVASEALMLKFAATAGLTTPTGSYQAQADFVATPTY